MANKPVKPKPVKPSLLGSGLAAKAGQAFVDRARKIAEAEARALKRSK